MGDNKTPSNASRNDSVSEQPAGSRLVRRSPRLLALEQRFVFDGAAVADVVDASKTVDSGSDAAGSADSVASQASSLPPSAVVDSSAASAAPTATDSPQPGASSTTDAGDSSPQTTTDSSSAGETLLHLDGNAASLGDAASAAEQMIRDFVAQASDAQLFDLFNGGRSSPDAQWDATLAQLRSGIADGSLTLDVQLLDGAQMRDALAAYAGQGPDGSPVIFVNAGWLGLLDTPEVSRLLVEEYGHHLDHLLNPGGDTAGDEGQRFAALVTQSTDSSTPGFASDDDHRTLQLDGEALPVELATYSFLNAYEVNVASTPAGKEANSHDFFYTGGAVSVTVDDGNYDSRMFSGNDVSAVALNIGGKDYYGWISRPIKSGGVVRGFYFWTDNDFTSLGAAQADGNQDGDGNVADNHAFVLVVDQGWFDSLAWKDQSAGLKNVGSSSDRVDSALNSLIPSNVAPVAGADSGIAVEAGGIGNASAGSNASGNLLGNDSDANHDTLAVTSVSSNATASSASVGASAAVVSGLYGQLTLAANGTYTYAVNNDSAAVQALRSSGNTLTDTFTYTVSDGKGGSATTTLQVTVQGANDAPSAADDYNAAKESIAASNNYSASDSSGALATGNVLNNDSDVDRNGETKTVVDVGISGSATGDTAAAQTVLSFSTLPSNVSVGYFVLLDGDNTDNDKTPGTPLLDANGNPITILSIDTTAKTFTLSGKVSNATLAQNGTQLLGFSNKSDGSSAYKDATIQSSTIAASTQIVLSAAQGSIAVGMSVGGTGLSSAPTVTAISYDGSGNIASATLSQAVALSHQALTFSAAANAGSSLVGKYGTLQLNTDGSYTYTPTANNPALSEGQSGVESFRYSMRDASGATSTATLYITVRGSGSNDPNAVADSASATEAGGVANAGAGSNPSGNLLGNDTTPTGSSNSVVDARASGAASATAVGSATPIAGLYGSLSLSADGSYSYTLDNDNARVQALRGATDTLSDTFVYTVRNSLGFYDAATLTITIAGANDAPVAGNDSATASEAGGTANAVAGYDPSGNVLANDSDVDDLASELRVSAVRTGSSEGAGTSGTPSTALRGSYGTLLLNADGSWSYQVDNSNPAVNALAAGASLIDSFNYTVSDRSGTGLSDIGVLNITVKGATDTVAVNSVFVNEASDYAVFTVSGGAGVTVGLALSDRTGIPASDATATLGSDLGTQLEYFDGSTWQPYVAATPPSIPAGGELYVRVAIHNDNLHEGNESFSLVATTSDGSASTGIGTINDEGEGAVFLAGNHSGTPNASGDSGYPALDDDRPTLSVSNPSLIEGGSAQFTVSLDKLSSEDISFTPQLASGSASLGSDTAAATTLEVSSDGGLHWSSVTGPVTIAAGQSSVLLRLATSDDSTAEPTETFSLATGYVSGTVTNPTGAHGTATIADNDTAGNAPALIGGDDTGLVNEDASDPLLDASGSLTISDADPGEAVFDPASVSFVRADSSRDELGSLTLDSNGHWTYTVANADLQYLGANDRETLAYQVASADGTTHSLVITLAGRNDAPTAALIDVSTLNAGNTSIDTATPLAWEGEVLHIAPGSIVAYGRAGYDGWAFRCVDASGEIAIDNSTFGDPLGGVYKAAYLVTSPQLSSLAASLTERSDGSADENSGTLSGNGSIALTDVDLSDNHSASVSATVRDANGAPLAAPLGSLSLDPIDQNGDRLNWTFSVAASALDSLAAGEVRTQVYEVCIDDGHGGTFSQQVRITLTGAQDAAAIGGADTGAVTEDRAVDANGRLNAAGQLSVSDADSGEAAFDTASVSAADGTLGQLSLTADGQWTYQVANSAVQFLKAGETRDEVFTVRSLDGTEHQVTVTITGVNDAAAIAGNDTGAVTEDRAVDADGRLNAAGQLSVSDADSGEAAFDTASVSAADGTLGQLTLTADGQWTYQVANSAVQFLKAGETRDEVFTVRSLDGTEHQVTVTITGVNDAAAIAGDDTGAVTEDRAVDADGRLNATGQLSVSDADSGEAAFDTASVSAADGTLGQLSLAADGQWTYQVANSAVQFLKAGETRDEVFTVRSLDGTEHQITVTITGVNDAAAIAGNDTGAVTEDRAVDADGRLNAAGQLSVSDADSGEAAFDTASVSAADGTLGQLTLTTDGQWTYQVANSALQFLKAGETRNEVFTVRSLDGTEHQVTVTITGVNDAAAIGGGADGANARGSVQEDTTLAAGGQLTIADPDRGEARFVAQPATAGSYGSFSLSSDGHWTYTLNNDAANVQRLTGSDTVTERFVVQALDGTTSEVLVSVRGLDDVTPVTPTPPAPPAPAAQPDSPVPANADNPAPAAQPFDSTLAMDGGLPAPLAQAQLPVFDLQQGATLSDVYTSSTGFRVVVKEADEPSLMLYRGIADQYVESGGATSIATPYDAFVHTDPNARVSLTATQSDGQALPGWIHFNAQTGKFEVRAPAGFRGELTIKLAARDSQGREVSTLFRVNVGNRAQSSLGNGRSGLSEQLRQAAKRPVFALASPAGIQASR